MRPFFRALELIGALLTALPFIFWGFTLYIKWHFNVLVWLGFTVELAEVLTAATTTVLLVAGVIGPIFVAIETSFRWRVLQYVKTGRIWGRVTKDGLHSADYRWADES